MSTDDADDVFADLRLGMLENMAAAGEPVSEAEMEDLRERIRNRDPACWYWPAPDSCTFAGDETAGEFLSWWNQGCAICGVSGELVEDHDHKTALVRGYLCGGCNTAEGISGNGTYRKYRERNPASILGIRVRYWGAWAGEAVPEAEPADEDRAALRAAVDRLSLPSPDSLTVRGPA